MNEYLVVDIGTYLLRNSLLALIAAQLDTAQRSKYGV